MLRRAHRIGKICGLTAAVLGFPALASCADHASSVGVNVASAPDFSGIWVRAWKQPQLFEPPDSGPGPVTGDPTWPHARGVNAPWIADLDNPILKPQTRARLQELADQQKAGHALLDNDTQCLPLGVLATLNLFDAMQMLQTPEQVTFLYARDHQVRIVRLNQPHSKSIPSSWYGESVGHYEGDTLVVDTVGMNEKTLVDRYGTPHSGDLHTVERYRLSGNGMLQAVVSVEDPKAFTVPWTARADYRHDTPPVFEEIVCAENNRPAGDQGLRIPMAARSDF